MDNYEVYAEEMNEKLKAQIIADNMKAFASGKEYGYELGRQDTYDDLMDILKSFDRPLAEQVAECYERGEW